MMSTTSPHREKHADLHGMVRRLASRLNRGGLVGKTSDEFIHMMGGRHVACLSKRKEAHLYVFGPEHDGVVLFEVDNSFITGSDAALELFQENKMKTK